jgi:hypothetical protein
MRAGMRKIAGATGLVLASVLVTLAVAEILLRLTSYANVRAVSYTYPEDYFVADEVLGYDILPNVSGKTHTLPDMPYELFSNRYGCFDYDRDVPQDYTLVIGDSMAWGYSPLDKKWTTRLEALSGNFMLKCAVTGYGTKQELLKAQKVVGQVGHAPKRIIAMYIVNDFNDDYLFPQRTVYGGKLVSYINNLNLETGEINRRTSEEIADKNAKYKEGTLSNAFREWRYDLVIYNLFKLAKTRMEERMAETPQTLETQAVAHGTHQKTPDNTAKILPKGQTESVYRITLAAYLDTDLPWFNAAMQEHKRNVLAMMEYADSIGAKLLFVDTYGLMQHAQFDDVRKAFADSPRHDYYNLQSDYYPFDTWEHDAHWNIVGNQKAAEHLYAHAQRTRFFED